MATNYINCTTVANHLITWGDTTGDTLMQASVKLNSTIFKDTSDMNLIVIDETNAAIRWAIFVNIISGATNVAMSYETVNFLTSGFC
jgi:hypothetical protein